MELTFDDAKALATGILERHGVASDHAYMVADHLIVAAAAGHAFAGLPRILALVDNLRNKPPARPITIVKEGEHSALIDGGDTNGYVTSLIGIDKAIELAKKSGVGIIGVRNSWFSGRLAYYVERAAREDLIAFHTANTTARVAPHGGIDRIFGTNPMAFAFPCDGDPLVVDFGTGSTTWGEVLLRQKTGRPLDEGWAVDPVGKPTMDPATALEGAILPWGAHRGYGLSLVIQVLGILAGSNVVIEKTGDSGFFFLVFDPELLMPLREFKARVAELRHSILASRPMERGAKVRIPGEGSQHKRRLAEERGTIEVDDQVYAALRALADEAGLQTTGSSR